MLYNLLANIRTFRIMWCNYLSNGKMYSFRGELYIYIYIYIYIYTVLTNNASNICEYMTCVFYLITLELLTSANKSMSW